MSQIGGFALPSVENNKPYGIVFDLPAAFLETVLQIDDPSNYFYL